MTIRRLRAGSCVAALVLTTALAGCGDDGGDEGPSGGETPPSVGELHLPPFELPAEFRDCMAEEGVDIPASGDLPPDVDTEQFEEALQVCGELLHP